MICRDTCTYGWYGSMGGLIGGLMSNHKNQIMGGLMSNHKNQINLDLIEIIQL